MAGHPKSTKFSEAIGLRIKKLCLENYKNKSECARALGVSPQNWTRIEAGRVRFTPDDIFIYAGFFGVDPSWLLTGKGEGQSTDMERCKMSDTLESILKNKMKDNLSVKIETLATGGERKSSYSGYIVAVGEDYVTLKAEGYPEDIIALKYIVCINPIGD